MWCLFGRQHFIVCFRQSDSRNQTRQTVNFHLDCDSFKEKKGDKLIWQKCASVLVERFLVLFCPFSLSKQSSVCSGIESGNDIHQLNKQNNELQKRQWHLTWWCFELVINLQFWIWFYRFHFFPAIWTVNLYSSRIQLIEIFLGLIWRYRRRILSGDWFKLNKMRNDGLSFDREKWRHSQQVREIIRKRKTETEKREKPDGKNIRYHTMIFQKKTVALSNIFKLFCFRIFVDEFVWLCVFHINTILSKKSSTKKVNIINFQKEISYQNETKWKSVLFSFQ